MDRIVNKPDGESDSIDTYVRRAVGGDGKRGTRNGKKLELR